MLQAVPWANAITATTLIIYLIFWLLSLITPPLFKLLFNAAFLGVNVSSFYKKQSLKGMMATLITLGVTTWILGYIWVALYNMWAK